MAAANGTSEASSQSSPKSLTVWYYPDVPAEVWDKVVAAWAKIHPDVKIDGQTVPWDGNDAKYATAIAGGTLPDVGYTYASQANAWVVVSHVLAPLDPFLGGKLTKDNLAGTDGYTYDGKLYAMPLFAVAKGPIFYNKDLFKAAGVDGIPTDHPMTHQEWLDLSAKLVKNLNGPGKPKVYAFAWPGTPDASSADWIMPIFWSAGATMIGSDGKFGLNTPQGIAALKYIVDYEKNYSPPGGATLKYSDMDQLFLTGKTAMVMDNTRIVPQAEEAGINWDVGMAPKWMTNITGYATADAMCMFTTSKAQQLGWDWIKLVMSDDIAPLVDQSVVHASARLDIGAKPLYAMYQDKGPLYKKMLDIAAAEIPHGREHDLNPNIDKLWEIALNAVDEALLGQKTPEQALKDAEVAGNQVLSGK